MRPGHGGIDGYPSDIDNEASKFKWEENKEEEIVSIPDGEIKIDVDESKRDSVYEEDWEISSEKIEDVNVDEKRENIEGGIANEVIETVEVTPEELKSEEIKKTPEMTEETVDLSDDQIKQYKEEMFKDFENSEKSIKIEGTEKNWSESDVQDKIESNRLWTESMQLDYFKDVLNNEEKLKKESGGVDDERWNRMSIKLENLIAKKDWDKVIALAGSMNNLEPEKFKEMEKTLLDQKAEDGILNEIDKMRGVNGYRVEANPYRFALEIVSVAESFPELRKKIEINKSDLEVLKGHLTKKRNEDKVGKEINEIGTKGSNWKIDQLAKNMKKIDKLEREGKIIITK